MVIPMEINRRPSHVTNWFYFYCRTRIVIASKLKTCEDNIDYTIIDMLMSWLLDDECRTHTFLKLQSDIDFISTIAIESIRYHSCGWWLSLMNISLRGSRSIRQRAANDLHTNSGIAKVIDKCRYIVCTYRPR